jgi:hypothetical protein
VSKLINSSKLLSEDSQAEDGDGEQRIHRVAGELKVGTEIIQAHVDYGPHPCYRG